jgi:hypothetical protein
MGYLNSLTRTAHYDRYNPVDHFNKAGLFSAVKALVVPFFATGTISVFIESFRNQLTGKIGLPFSFAMSRISDLFGPPCFW